MKTIVTIRHGPVANAEQWFSGCLDLPLSEEGKRQAQLAAGAFAAYRVERVFVSPLSRALHTAEILFPGNRSIQLLPDLRERSLGAWEGYSKTELRRSHPEAFLQNGRLDPLFTPPHGEPIAELLDRLRAAVRIATAEATVCAFVTHNGVICAMRALLDGMDLRLAFEESEPHLVPRVFQISANCGGMGFR